MYHQFAKMYQYMYTDCNVKELFEVTLVYLCFFILKFRVEGEGLFDMHKKYD